MNQTHGEYSVHPIGYIRSTLRALDEAPRQGSEGAPDAWLEVNPSCARGLLGNRCGGRGHCDHVAPSCGSRWARSCTLGAIPKFRSPVSSPQSPHRPNPLELHRVVVREISGNRLRIGPIEAIDDMPVIDVKVVSTALPMLSATNISLTFE